MSEKYLEEYFRSENPKTELKSAVRSWIMRELAKKAMQNLISDADYKAAIIQVQNSANVSELMRIGERADLSEGDFRLYLEEKNKKM